MVETAALEAVDVELAKSRLEELALGGLGCLHTERGACHTAKYTDWSVWLQEATTSWLSAPRATAGPPTHLPQSLAAKRSRCRGVSMAATGISAERHWQPPTHN